jgi:hypothetical protein
MSQNTRGGRGENQSPRGFVDLLNDAPPEVAKAAGPTKWSAPGPKTTSTRWPAKTNSRAISGARSAPGPAPTEIRIKARSLSGC